MTATTSTKKVSYFGKRYRSNLLQNKKSIIIHIVLELLGLPVRAVIGYEHHSHKLLGIILSLDAVKEIAYNIFFVSCRYENGKLMKLGFLMGRHLLDKGDDKICKLEGIAHYEEYAKYKVYYVKCGHTSFPFEGISARLIFFALCYLKLPTVILTYL